MDFLHISQVLFGIMVVFTPLLFDAQRQLLYAGGKWQHVVSAAVDGLSEAMASFAPCSLLSRLDLLSGPSCGSTCDGVLSSLSVKLGAAFRL